MNRKFATTLTLFALSIMMSLGQTITTDAISGLEYLDDGDGKKYIWVGDSNLPISGGGTIAPDYFIRDPELRQNLRSSYNGGNAKLYKTSLDTKTNINCSSYNNVATYYGIQYFQGMTTFRTGSSSVTTGVELDLSKNTKLTALYFGSSNIGLSSLDISNTKMTTTKTIAIPSGSSSTLQKVFASNSSVETITVPTGNYVKTFVAKDCPSLNRIQCESSLLEKIDVRGSSALKKLHIKEGRLTSDSIFLEGCTSLETIVAHRHRFVNLDFLEPVIHNLTQLQVNGGKYVHVSGEVFEPTQVIKSVDSSKLPTTLTIMMVRHNVIDTLNLSMQTEIEQLEANHNRLWALNLENLQKLRLRDGTTTPMNCGVKNQYPFHEVEVVKDESVIDGSNDAIIMRIPNNNMTIHTDRISNFTILGRKYSADEILKSDENGHYFRIPCTNTDDVNLHNDTVRYVYDTKAMVGNVNEEYFAEARMMDVNVITDPYIMYMNPLSKSGEGVDYYSGTIYLDYDAIVPKGVEVFIATGIKDANKITSNGTAQAEAQVDLVRVGVENDTIPAFTPLYVRSNTAAGLYGFHKTWTPDYVGWVGGKLMYKKISKGYTNSQGVSQSTLDSNILVGTLSDITVGKRTVLTLGRQNMKKINGEPTMMIGFWPYNGTTVRAHRCYIPESALNGVELGSAKGVTFNFTNLETTSHIPRDRNVEEGTSYYTIQGIKVGKAGVGKGVYIVGNRKYVVTR